MTFELAPFAPGTLVRNTLALLEPRAAAKGIPLRAEADPDLPDTLIGDAGRIQQVLLNLLSNAVKFTESGSVTLTTRHVSATDGRATVEWTIQDSGIGRRPQLLDELLSHIQVDWAARPIRREEVVD